MVCPSAVWATCWPCTLICCPCTTRGNRQSTVSNVNNNWLNALDTWLRRIQHLVLSCRDGRLGLLDDDLLRLTLLTLELESLATLKLDLTWLHQLDLPMETTDIFRTSRQCFMWSDTNILAGNVAFQRKNFKRDYCIWAAKLCLLLILLK